MNTMNQNPVDTPKQAVTPELKKELEKMAEEKKNPNLVESFNNFIARKAAQVF